MFAPVAEQKVLTGTAATLRWQYLDQDGEPTDPGTVTVGIDRADGTEVLPAGTVTVDDGTARTVTLTPAQISALDVLTATWTRTADGIGYTTLVDVAGGVYFTVAQARNSDPALTDDVKYPTVDLQEDRGEVENEFERICEVAFVPRYRREALDGSGSRQLMLPTPLPRTVRSVTELDTDGTETAWPASDVANIRPNESGTVTSPRGFPAGAANVIVEWEHGHDRPPPDVRQAALLRLRHRAIRSHTAIPDRATSFQVEGGSVYRLDTAGRAKTGIPDVDAVLDRWSMAVPGIA